MYFQKELLSTDGRRQNKLAQSSFEDVSIAREDEVYDEDQSRYAWYYISRNQNFPPILSDRGEVVGEGSGRTRRSAAHN